MCHLILLLPFAGLAVFWVLPLFPALLVYVVLVVLSVLLYVAVFRAQCREACTGAEAVVGARALVVRVQSDKIVVRLEGALWSSDVAGFRDLPRPGDSVMVVGVVGNRLRTSPLDSSVRPASVDGSDGAAQRGLRLPFLGLLGGHEACRNDSVARGGRR